MAWVEIHGDTQLKYTLSSCRNGVTRVETMTGQWLKLVWLGISVLLGFGSPLLAREEIRVVGSPLAYPFVVEAAEQFSKTSKFKAPIVESTDTANGLKLFCAGLGPEHPDITSAARRINRSEFQLCESNDVKDIVELPIGTHAFVVAQSKNAQPMRLTRAQLLLALAKEVPDADGRQRIANPYIKWSDIDRSLPNVTIEVFGAPATLGTHISFSDLMGNETLRQDGAYVAYVDAGENDRLITGKLAATPHAIGIFGFSFLEQNLDKLRGLEIDGVEPTYDSVSAGQYRGARPLYIYVKKSHIGVIPRLREFVRELGQAHATGAEGYLARKGLVPLPQSWRSEMEERTRSLTTLSPNFENSPPFAQGGPQTLAVAPSVPPANVPQPAASLPDRVAATKQDSSAALAATTLPIKERRHALIIGNSEYNSSMGKLRNPANDARLMARTLRGLGFDVLLVLDANLKAMKGAVRDFGGRLEMASRDGVALFFYAGHGVQVNGQNFLIPVDAEIRTEADVDVEALSADSVLKQMDYAKSNVNVVILDACRDNPFARSFRSAMRGLAPMDAPNGSFISYATAPGDTAADGLGDNSPFTTALERAINVKGLPIELAFKNVARDVRNTTSNRQRPWMASSLIGDFYFAGN